MCVCVSFKCIVLILEGIVICLIHAIPNTVHVLVSFSLSPLVCV